jgi:HK97 gp10 family phage protein
VIQIILQGNQELVDGLGRAASAVGPEARAATQTSLMILEADMRAHVPRDTGQLGNSLTTHIGGSATEILGSVGPTAAYWPFVHDGTRPHWPSIAAITPWANRHGIPPFLVARAIARHGTRPRPFASDALARNVDRIRAVFQAVGLNVALRMARR